MCDEPPNLVENLVQISIAENGAKTLDERTECRNSTVAQVNVERCRRADDAARAETVRKVDQETADRQEAQVHELIDRFPTDRAAWCGLRDLSLGVKYLVEQVSILEDTLAGQGYLEPGDRLHLIRLAGKDARWLFTDRWVFQIDCDCLGSIHGAGKLTALQAAEALASDCPDGVGPQQFARRLEPLVASMVDQDQARGYLKDAIEAMKKELLDRLEVARRREADVRAAAIALAQVDVSAEGEKRSRYINRNLRLRYAALRELRALKKDRRDNDGEVVAHDDPPAAAGGPTTEVPATVPQAPGTAGESKANWPADGAGVSPEQTAQTTSDKPVMSARELGAREPSGTPQNGGEVPGGAAEGVLPCPSPGAAAGA
jgi:hypothetical protein